MQGVLSRLRIGTKLGASAFGFVIPIAVMAAIILNGYARDIRFSELELMGNRIIEPLVEIAAAAPLLGGDDAADREQAEAVIGGRIDELQDIHLEIGTDLQFTDEGLASRGREGLDAPGLRRIWNRYDGADASSRAAVARDLFGHALRMIAHAGDTSNLILDPDLDSYYLMDVTLLAVPLILDHLQMVASARELPPGDALITAALIERDLDRVTASINTAINEDANFYGVLGGMQAALQPALNSFRASATSVFGLLNAAAAGRESTEVERIAAATPMLAATHEFWTGVADQQNRLLRIRVDSYRRERAIALALSAAAVLAASVLVLVVARSIIRQARDTQAGLDAAAQRDLRVTIPAVTHDELGMAAAAAQSLITDLRQFVADLRKQSTNAQAYAEQLADGGSSLTSSTAGVATGLEELSATITAFSQTLQQIESNAAGQKQLADTTLEQMQALEQGYRQSLETMTKVAETASQNASVSEHSAEVVSASISDVRAITTDLEAIGRQVRSAGEASAGVDTIVATVRDIADRTSLLAMNAAIEAAHAGERGRGFAVVAGEIRSLSAGTATALQQIESQLNDMRSTIGGAVETAGAAEQRIGRIVSDTETARDSLDTVRRNAASVGDMIGTIRESVSSQSDSVRTVADALGQLGEASSGVLMAIEEQTVGAREMVDTVESIRGSTERNQQIADDVSALSGALTEESRALDAQVSEYQL